MAGHLFDLTDRVAVVFGAARGMSCPMAIGFVEYGADLLLADVDAAGMEDTAATIEALGRKAVPACAPSRSDQIDALYDTLDGSSLASTSRVTWRGALRDRIEVDPVLRSLPTSRLGQAEEINGLAILLLGRVVAHVRRARPPGRRQPRQERGRLAPRHAATRAVIAPQSRRVWRLQHIEYSPA